MEVKVSNISRYASSDVIRNIFSPLGEILHLEYYVSPQKKDGTSEADIIFSNLSEAKLALELGKTELGDTRFAVEPIMNRFRFSGEPGNPRVRLAQENSQDSVKTLLIRGLSTDLTRAALEKFLEELVREKPVMIALYGKNIVLSSKDVGIDINSAIAAVEFSSRSLLLRSLLALRALTPEKLQGIVSPGAPLQIDEAWKLVDPNIKTPEQLQAQAIFGKSSSLKQFSASSSSSAINDTRKDDLRHRDRERDSRDRSRSRDRGHRRRSSRSRSPTYEHRHRHHSSSSSSARRHRSRSRSRSRRY